MDSRHRPSTTPSSVAGVFLGGRYLSLSMTEEGSEVVVKGAILAVISEPGVVFVRSLAGTTLRTLRLSRHPVEYGMSCCALARVLLPHPHRGVRASAGYGPTVCGAKGGLWVTADHELVAALARRQQ